jgi:hypothetical protein
VVPFVIVLVAAPVHAVIVLVVTDGCTTYPVTVPLAGADQEIVTFEFPERTALTPVGAAGGDDVVTVAVAAVLDPITLTALTEIV